MEAQKFLLEELKSVYQIVKEQLVFAESKNAALIAFNIAAIAIFFDKGVNVVAHVICPIGFIISCIISLSSFSPLSYSVKNISKIDSDNFSLVYFRNIAAITSDQYLEKICQEIGVKTENLDTFPIASSYAQETTVLARITVLKNRAFSLAMWTSIVFLVVAAIASCFN